MKAAVSIVLGAILLIAAAAGFVIVSEHETKTTYFDIFSGSPCVSAQSGCKTVHAGWAHTQYDLGRVGTWACLIVGLLLVIVGLINLSRRPRLETTNDR